MDRTSLIATVDRIEHDEQNNELAVLIFDDAQQLIIPLDRLPDGCHAGAVLTFDLQVDSGRTAQRREHIKQVQSRLFGGRSQNPASDNREPQ